MIWSRVTVMLLLVPALVLAGCGSGREGPRTGSPPAGAMDAAGGASAGAGGGQPQPASTAAQPDPLPGMPPPLDPGDVYAADRPGMLSPAVRGFRPLIYVPNSRGASVDVIDPRTHKIVRHFKVPRMPQHVTPSYDLRTLWVASDEGNRLTPIDPRSGAPGRPLTVADPYNLYFTPDGRFAIVVAERLRRLDFRSPHTMKLRRSLLVPCNGVDHMDFSADGRYSMVSCEYSGELLKVDIARQRLLGVLPLRAGSMPQDVKLAPDGQVFYVADQAANGVWLVRGGALGEPARRVGFVATGKGAHGLYTSRDSRYLYVSNRGEGSVSVLSFASRKVVATWRLPGGGSPDMGGISANGRVLWLSGRYNGEIYAIDTRSGRLLARIGVGPGPHGLCVYPQPGRYSLGHTGVFR